jgi:iron complex outermembrane recepter protein
MPTPRLRSVGPSVRTLCVLLLLTFFTLLHPRLAAQEVGAESLGAEGSPSGPMAPLLEEEVPPSTIFAEIVVTAPQATSPLAIETDPKAPRQPLPAHDGADFLSSIPGFTVIRKGGTDGDPVFRGMAGSRLGIVLDGERLFGGCGGRMDPPTAYVYPDAYDSVTVLKGPQTVAHGPGHSAGTVLFERVSPPMESPGARLHASLVGGSFGRNDQAVDAVTAGERLYFRGIFTRSETGDYRDGAGREVHSRYLRWSGHAALGWTPDPRTVVELSTDASDGEAAYADRGMDGTRFRRQNVGLKVERQQLGSLPAALEGRLFYNYVDHVMDNYSLREPSGRQMVSNPDRETLGGRLVLRLEPGDAARLALGLDHQRDVHTVRGTMDQQNRPYTALPRFEDARFGNVGLFAEGSRALGAAATLSGGLRLDHWRADDRRETLGQGMPLLPNPTAELQRQRTLVSAFLRHEARVGGATLLAAGLGHSQRFPDYWELFSRRQSETGPSAFLTRPERTTQLDIGLVREVQRWQLGASTFASHVDDFILIDEAYPNKPGASVTRNIEAVTWGGEANAAWRSGPWGLLGTVAYVRGENRTDGTPLAQLPPLETRLAVSWNDGAWGLGGLVRWQARQHRVDPGAGNIAGLDLAETPSALVLSANGSWRSARGLLLAVGIDNLLDRDYVEHLSRAGAAVTGYPQTAQIHEPGRTLWARASIGF